ncbi:MAG: hypothetical protein HYX87_09780 [Chloroflexi bacterium]|nr:hypothetical protein [Chloroflexota bacterium]
MFRRARVKALGIILSLVLVVSGVVGLPMSAHAAAPRIVVSPPTVSLWGLGVLPAANFESGPVRATVIVYASETSTVTLNLKTVFESIFPTAAGRLQYLPSALREAYEARMAAFAAIPFVWDDALGAWVHELGSEMEVSEPSALVKALAETVLFQEAVLGKVKLPVKVNGTVYNSSVTVVDMQRPMLPGWNLVSTPVALGVSKWKDIVNLGSGLQYDAAVKWDARTQKWVNVNSSFDTLTPLNAVYLHTRDFATLPLIFSRQAMPPAGQSLKKGWNLVGPAVLSGKNAAGGQSYFEIPLDQAFGSIKGLYSVVVSPGEVWSYTEDFSSGASYTWGFNQGSFVYNADSGTAPQLTVGGGYWVFMDSDGTLAGSSNTPIGMSSWNPFD